MFGVSTKSLRFYKIFGHMNLAGWILLALVGVAFFGFAMFEIGKRQHKEQPSHADSYSGDRTDETNQQSDSNGAKQEKRESSRLARILKAANEYSGALLVAFTALLALATGFLWLATRDLVKGAEETAKKQLRAYVIPFKGDVQRFGISEPPKASVRIRNAGQTPAYRMTAWVKIAKGNLSGNDFSTPDIPLHPDILGPGMERSIEASALRPLTSEERAAVVQGTETVYVFGEIRYWDAFNIEHTSKFRRMTRVINGQLQMSEGGALILYNTKEGNEEN
jgi:hypothetical protein